MKQRRAGLPATGYFAATELEHAHSVPDAVFGVLVAALEPAVKVHELPRSPLGRGG